MRTKKVYIDSALMRIADEHLMYTDTTTREDFIKLFSLSNILLNKYGNFYINDNFYRKVFGRTKINGTMKWKLSYLLEACVEARIFERTGYSFGDKFAHSRQYNFTDYFIELYDRENIALYKEGISYKSDNALSNLSEEHYMCDCAKKQLELLKSDRFMIDDVAAMTWVNNTTDINLKINKATRIASLKNRHIYVITDERTGRIFTNFTSLKRELRVYCTIDGEKLKSVDLKSCQPILLANYFRNQNINHPELDKLFDILDNDIYDYFLKRFVLLNDSNTYRTFDIVTNKMVTATIKDREDSKIEMCKFMFKTTNKGTMSEYEKIFKLDFPFLYEHFKKLRETQPIWLMLQKMEAEIFIPVVSKFVKKGCLSLHDGIYFKSELRDDIIKALEESLDKHNIIGYQLKEK